MAPFFVICFILFALLNGGVQSAEWSANSLSDGQHLYTCSGDTVTLTWHYSLTSWEVLGDIRWLYDGQSQEVVAVLSNGNFLPAPSFSQRVSRVDNAGLSLSRVLVQDSGNYSVEVNHGGLWQHVLRRTAMLHVSDRLMTTDGAMHASQLENPVYDSDGFHMLLQLQCGNFIFKENPPYQLEWTTPSGAVHNSTSFSNGNFYLSVPMPIESGSYTCRIPAHLSARACLHGDGTNEGRASVTVDSVEARLLLLEKENSNLMDALTAVETMIEHILFLGAESEKKIISQNQTIADLASTLAAMQTSPNQEVQRLEARLNQTLMRLENIEDSEPKRVAFHAIYLSNTTVAANTPLAFNLVMYDNSNAYNQSSGYFTAPYSGLYFFVAKTAPEVDGTEVFHTLMVENRTLDMAYSSDPAGHQYADPTPVQAVVHLTQGERVYVKCHFTAQYWSSLSSFTGFLLSRDP